MTGELGRFFRQNAIAVLALFVALGGTSFAAATLINGKQIKPHTIARNRLTSEAIRQLRGARGLPGLQGARGATGPQGVQGLPGAAGPGARWVVVAPDGTIALQSGGIAVTRVSVGAYRVDFGSDVSHRLLLATRATASDPTSFATVIAGSCVPPAGSSNLLPCSSPANPDEVAVLTVNSTGSLEDHSFYAAELGPTATGA